MLMHTIIHSFLQIKILLASENLKASEKDVATQTED